ncbi:MAG: response regulator [Nannocystaceae bacterium]
MIKVILADDHPIIREGLRRLINLEPDMEVVAEAIDGPEAIQVLQTVDCDVIVLDLSLPHIRGLELLALIKEMRPTVRVLIFSVQPESRFSLYLMEAGASGYLSKDHTITSVLTAIRTIARGQTFITERMSEIRAECGDTQLAAHQRLSAREYQIFTRLIEGMSVSVIAGELEISASTVSNHLSRVREKLGVTHNGEVLLYAAKHDLLNR